MQTVVGAGILARGIAARNSVSYGCLQCCGQELKVSGAKRKANARSSYDLPFLAIFLVLTHPLFSFYTLSLKSLSRLIRSSGGVPRRTPRRTGPALRLGLARRREL